MIINLLIVSIITENIVLFKFLGLCPFIGTSSNPKSAFNMGIAVTLVTTISSIIIWFIYNYILVPYESTYILTIISILIIASLVQLLEIIIKKNLPSIHKQFGIYLPLITTNCAVLGVSLLNITNSYNLLQTFIYSMGSGIGFTIVIYIFASMREKIDNSEVPQSFKGLPIALIVAGIMAMIFSRFTI